MAYKIDPPLKALYAVAKLVGGGQGGACSGNDLQGTIISTQRLQVDSPNSEGSASIEKHGQEPEMRVGG